LSEHAPLPQDAFRTRPVSDEDKYFAQREAEILEDLKDARAARAKNERHCPCAECEGAVLDRVNHDNVEIDTCPKCKGVWLDAGELELLVGRANTTVNPLTKFFRNLAGDYSV
jgi:Zn-finger nucleic acid-binding protein